MKWLIDARKLLGEIASVKWESRKDYEAMRGIVVTSHNVLLDDHDTTARANAHGHWIDHSGKGYTQLYCSVCLYENTERTNFCPNCGADMSYGESL